MELANIYSKNLFDFSKICSFLVLTFEIMFDIITIQRTNVPNKDLVYEERKMTERELRSYRNKMRRVRELRRKVVMAVVTVLVVLCFALSYNALITQATSEVEDISYKYFTSIEIAAGDTLWSIAQEYGDAQYYASADEYIEEVKNTNHLTSDALIAGQFLIVPYYSQEFIK